MKSKKEEREISGVIVNQFAEGNDHQTVCGSEFYVCLVLLLVLFASGAPDDRTYLVNFFSFTHNNLTLADTIFWLSL